MTSPAPAAAQPASLQERRPRTLKQGDSFGLFDRAGDIDDMPGSPEGLFHHDTRYLSRLRLTLNGALPVLLGSAVGEDNLALTADFTNPDLSQGDARLARGSLHLRRVKFIHDGAIHERVAIRNHGDTHRSIELGIGFAADFADLFEVRGRARPRRGRLHDPVVTGDGVVLAYTGLDEVTRRLVLRFAPQPASIAGDHARFVLDLPPGTHCSVFLSAQCGDRPMEPADRAFPAAYRGAHRALRRETAHAETSHDIFNEVLRRAHADLRMLTTRTPHGPFPYAGIPWFSTAFGRDALITAWQALWFDPGLALGVLRFLAATQATANDPANDAEPGKILHEARGGEMAALGEVPYGRYYGSVDSTPLFVMLAGAWFDRTGDVQALGALAPAIDAALGWIEAHADADGFVSYHRRSEKGLINQGWKDSNDSVHHADGRLAEGPIALVEMQAYVHAAWAAGARIARALGDPLRGAILASRAAALRERFDESFWDEALGTYVLALDGQRRPCRVRSSNAGHALFAGIALPERVPRLVETLMHPACFSGWGIRTLATDAARYNPMSYHNGSVWPHDNAMIAEGLARYGYGAQAARVLEGLFAAAENLEMRRLPELFCGFPRRAGQGPTPYPVACAPQAWAAVTPLSLLAACLGLRFDPAQRIIAFDSPVLPGFLDEVVLRGLALGEARLDVAISGAQQAVAMAVLARSGTLRAVMTS